MKKYLLALIVVAMLVSACGSQEKATNTPQPADTPIPPTTTAAPAPTSAPAVAAATSPPPTTIPATPTPPPLSSPSPISPTTVPPPPDAPSEEVFFEAAGDANLTTRPLPSLKPPATGHSPPANPTLGDTWVRPADGAVMVYVPAGEFMMGSSQAEIEAQVADCEKPIGRCSPDFYRDETPQHPVSLDGFWIDQFEVTNIQLIPYLNEVGNWREGGGSVIRFGRSYCRIQEGEDEYWVTEAAADHPVVMVSGYGAEAYCQWVGARLSTEAEWEYAARGPEGYLYPWGDAPPSLELARYSSGSTVAVGSYPDGVSWCGAQDMAGNVWEWTSDWFGPYPTTPQDNPTGPDSGTIWVLRGGGWHSSQWQVRSVFRLHDTAPSSVNG